MSKVMKFPLAHEQSVLEVGKRYLVAHVYMADDGMAKDSYPLVPVIPHIHKDEQLGVGYEHLHVDGRFYVDRKSAASLELKDGVTSQVISIINELSGSRVEMGKDGGFVYKVKKCLRLTTGLPIKRYKRTNDFLPPTDVVLPNSIAGYWKWYEQYIGKSCKGRRCPHMGTVMIECDGKLVCPLHKLMGDVKTEKIIEAEYSEPEF